MALRTGEPRLDVEAPLGSPRPDGVGLGERIHLRLDVEALQGGRRLPVARLVGAVVGLFWLYTLFWLMAWVLAPTLLLGWEAVVITSGSMQPALSPGDVVVASPPTEAIGPGTVVVFHDADGRLVTHRIVAVADDGTYVTRGDASGSDDSTPLDPADIVGVGRILVPAVGLSLVWAWSGAWVKLLLVMAATAVAFWLARWAWMPDLDPGAAHGTP
jgi:signal peptidase